MAILPIRVAPDPVLRRRARRVSSIDVSIHRLISDMIETMRDAPGVGLAAPQVGISLRVIVIGLPQQEELALI
ncbi:MAG: peptide deformylase, partial [Chloroflexi bacterium]|nr:peptide deformylase [Chloroflexota bacterium]